MPHRSRGVRVARGAAGKAQQGGADGADGDRHVQPGQEGALVGEEGLGLDALRDGGRQPRLRLQGSKFKGLEPCWTPNTLQDGGGQPCLRLRPVSQGLGFGVEILLSLQSGARQ